MIIGDKFCSICGGSAAAVDVWCCGKLVLNNFCVQYGQPAAAATAITVKEEAVVIKMEPKADKEEEVIYISD